MTDATAETKDYLAAQTAQADAANPAQSAWVAANAGSGKTKVLIDRVARLLLNGAAPDSILCVTYTKAAANEMLDRLYQRLGAWSTMETGTLGGQLRALEGDADKIYSDDELRQARALFARALETPGGLRIETIHAFCARVLRRFPLEAGVPPGFQEIEDDEANTLWAEAVSAAVLAAPEAELDAVAIEGGGWGADAGLSALKAGRSAVSAFAHAHDGDIDAMSETVRQQIGAPAEAAASILERAMGADFPEQDLSVCIPVLMAGGSTDQKTGQALQEALATDDPERRWMLYRAIFATKQGSWRASNPYTQKSADLPLIPDLFQMKDGLGREAERVQTVDLNWRKAQAVTRTRALLSVGLPALDDYRLVKRRRAALDFDDLIQFTRDLLADQSRVDWVLYKLDGGLTHVLLDEAQDTSPDQWSLIHALTEEFFAGKGADRSQSPRTLFVVGDEKQSIYSFQGAAPEKFLSQGQSFETRCQASEHPYAMPSMEMSFRSSPDVLQVVDAVFDTDAFDGAPFAVAPPPEADLIHHTARRAGEAGLVELWPVKPRADVLEDDPWDAPVDMTGESAPKTVLANDVADAIKAMLDARDSVWSGGTRRAMRPEDVLILVRARTGGLFESMIRALKDRGLPVAGADRLKLADHIGVQDCLNLIRFALLPEDDLTLAEILRGPFCNLVDDDIHLFPLAHGRGRASLWSRLQGQTGQPFGDARVLCERLIGMAALPAFEFLTALLEAPLLGKDTGWDLIGSRLGSPARDPIEALLARALAHDASGPASLQTFVSAMDSDGSEIKRDLAAPNGEIRVMTVHGAKGLQAPVVILPDTTSAVKPARETLFNVEGVPVWSPSTKADIEPVEVARELEKQKALREHRRLLYVALTRAQDRLIIGGAWHGGASGDGRDKNSWHALCENGLRRLGAEEDEDGILRFGEQPPASSDEGIKHKKPTAPDWLRRPAPQESGTPAMIAPSALSPGGAPVLPPIGQDRRDRLQRGRAIHALLQRLPDISADRRPEAARAYLSGYPEFSDEAREEMVMAAFGVLDDPSFAEVFAPGGRAEAAVTGTAPELPDDRIVNGRVDRLVTTDTDVLIVDFKTDRPAPDDENGVADTYLAQMGAYRAVLSTAYPGRTIRCALVWTDGPKLMPLSDEAMLAALNRASAAL
ncbi:MAG: double-strand break repair helicase AddA [Pseudomonadota bacterium]